MVLNKSKNSPTSAKKGFTPKSAKLSPKVIKKQKLQQDSDDGNSDVSIEDFKELMDGPKLTVKKNQQKNTPKKNNQVSPVGKKQNKRGHDDDGDENETPEINTKKIKLVSESPVQVSAQEQMNKKLLFVKNLVLGTTEEEVKSLSKEILDVRIRHLFSKRTKTFYAYLTFENEKVADKHFKSLQGKTLKGQAIVVDYVGEKSNNPESKVKETARELDPKKLYISGFNRDTINLEELKKIFIKSSDIILPKKKDGKIIGYAFVQFPDEKSCKESHDSKQNISLDGKILTVLYAKKFVEKINKSEKKGIKNDNTANKVAVKGEAVKKVVGQSHNKNQKGSKKLAVIKQQMQQQDSDDDQDDDDELEDDDSDDD